MMRTIKRRISALEQIEADCRHLLPVILPDDATDEQLEAIRATGRAAFRESDPALMEAFI